MSLALIEIIFYLLVIDSVLANVVAWGFEGWYVKHFRLMSRWFPAGRGWTTYYFILVLWIGYRLEFKTLEPVDREIGN